MTLFAGYRDVGETDEEGLHKGLDRILTGAVPIVHSSTSLQVVQRAAGANMSVDISIGDAFIDNGDYGFWVWSDAAENVSVDAADPSNPRIDVVVGYMDLSVVDNSVSNNPGAFKVVSVDGTPAGSPTAPDGTAIQTAVGAGNPYIMLAQVAVAASATQIVDANITDVRDPIGLKGRLYGGSNNTDGHTVPNVADDTVALLGASQTVTGDITFSGAVNINSFDITGAWQTWTPTWSNVTVGNGTLSACGS